MKNMIILFVGVLLLGTIFSSCLASEKPLPAYPEKTMEDKKILIVYLSRTQNTKAVAQIIHENAGGTLVELDVETPYPSHYQTMVNQVAEENRTGFLPILKTTIENIEQYDMVFVGFPTWGMQLPPPIKSFLHQYNLSGKIVIPFNTNGGYGMGNSFQTVKELCPDSEVLDGFTTKGGSERNGVLYVMEGEREVQVQSEIRNWLHKMGITK